LILTLTYRKIGGEKEMERLEKIKSDIEQLSPEEFQELKKWILQKDWEMWDKELEMDSKLGKLDF